MTESLVDLLRERGADPDTVQQTVRLVVGEITDDLPPQRMIEQLREAAVDPALLDAEVDRMKTDPEALDELCLAVLSDIWETESNRASVTEALDEAKTDLPVIELSLLAVVAMYGMWLRKTGGVRHAKRVVKRSPDGTITDETETEFYGASGPLRAVMDIFGGGA